MKNVCDICSVLGRVAEAKVYQMRVKGYPDLTSGHISIIYQTKSCKRQHHMDMEQRVQGQGKTRFLVKLQTNTRIEKDI